MKKNTEALLDATMEISKAVIQRKEILCAMPHYQTTGQIVIYKELINPSKT